MITKLTNAKRIGATRCVPAFACVSASLPSYALGLTPSAQQRSTAPWSLFGRAHRRMGPSRARAQRERQRLQAALSAASCCRGLTPGRTMGGRVSRWPCRYLVGARAATRSLPLHHHRQSRRELQGTFHTHTASRCSTGPTHTCRRPTFSTNPCMDLSSLGAAPIGAPPRGSPQAACATRRAPGLAPGLKPGLKPGLAPGLAPEHGAVLGPQTRSRTRVPCRVVVTTHLPMPRPTTSRRTSSTYACSSATVASASRPCRWGRLRVG